VSRRAYPGNLVLVEKRASQVEEWAQHQIGEKHGDPESAVALRVEQHRERVLGDADSDNESGERSQSMDVVGGS